MIQEAKFSWHFVGQEVLIAAMAAKTTCSSHIVTQFVYVLPADIPINTILENLMSVILTHSKYIN